MTYSYDLAGTGDTLITSYIRLEIGDTDNATDKGIKPDGSNFTDEELLAFYGLEGDVKRAAARACEVLARMWAGAGESVRIRDYQIDTTKKAEHYRNLANDLRKSVNLGVGVITRTDAYSDSGSEYT